MSKQFKNRLRGARNPHKTLSELRPAIAPKQYKDLLTWLPGLLGRRVRVLNPAFPPTYKSLIPQAVPLAAIPLQRELLWITARLLNDSQKLNAFITLRSDIESCWLAGDFLRVENLLDQLEATLGVSFFALEMRLAIVQQSKGLERQKQLMSDIRQLSPSSLLRFTTFYFSQRNEPATNPTFFRRRVEREIATLQALQEVKDYLRFRQLRELPEEPSRIAGLLRVEANSALVDQYETMIETLTELSGQVQYGLEALAQLQARIQDPRLARLRVLYTGELTESSSLTSCTLESLLDKGFPDATLYRL